MTCLVVCQRVEEHASENLAEGSGSDFGKASVICIATVQSLKAWATLSTMQLCGRRQAS